MERSELKLYGISCHCNMVVSRSEIYGSNIYIYTYHIYVDTYLFA